MPSPARKTVLVIDDSPDIRGMFRYLFAPNSIDVEGAASYNEGLTRARQGAHDGLIVDVSLDGQDTDGVRLVEALRGEGDQRPIMIITGRQDADLPARCYRAGADVVLHKPCAIDLYREAMLRLLSRTGQAPTAGLSRVDGSVLPREKFTFAGATVDPVEMKIWGVQADTAVPITLKEAALLFQLFRHVGRSVTRADLSVLVWGAAVSLTSNTLDMHMSRLRKHYRLIGLELDLVLSAQPKMGWHIKPTQQ